MLAPIILFVYNRPEHTLKTLDALSKNDLADQSILYIYADGPKIDADEVTHLNIKKTREVIRSKQWCKDVFFIESDINQGLADSIVTGVTEIVNKHGEIIVLEDDIVTSIGFLKYMNNALNLYKGVDKVFHIAAHFHPIPYDLPELFFYNANTCWGWATWKRAWDYFIWDLPTLLNNLNAKKDFTLANFNKGQGKAFTDQLKANADGFIRTWAIRWHATIFLYDGFCLHTGKSLVRNIGCDGSGVHCGINLQYINQKTFDYVDVKIIELAESSYVVNRMTKFNGSNISEDVNNSTSLVRSIGKYFLNKIRYFKGFS